MSSKTKGQIFITDDDSDDREFIINALQRDGFRGKVIEFENGELLSNYLQNHPEDLPDLILLDLNMPVKNGFDTLREIKSKNGFSNIPVVVLSASTKVEDERVCFQAGCSHFLSKPLDMAGYKNIARFVDSKFFPE